MSNTKSQISTKELAILRSKLPHGALKKIAEKTGLDISTVSKVFKGSFFNQEVILSAIELVKKTKIEQENLSTEINNL